MNLLVLSQEIVTRLHDRTKDFLREKQNNILKSKEKKLRSFAVLRLSLLATRMESKKKFTNFELKNTTSREEKHD